LDSDVTIDAATVQGQQGMVWLRSCRQEGGLSTEKHTDGFRPMKTELFHVHAVHERDPHRVAAVQRSAVLCCNVL
jgi:hypothetical protein